MKAKYNYPTIQIGKPIADAMKIIDEYSMGICFVFDNLVLVGLLTDGDIRRAIINGAKLTDCIESIVKKTFYSLGIDCTIESIQRGLAKYKYIPIINESLHLVDVASSSSYHHIPLAKPVLTGNELEYVSDCITSGWISSQGKYVNQFEDNFSKFIGANHALAVSNGTVALHLALVALGVGPGDEVIVPNLTFAAPVNAILYVGATPVLIDVEEDSMCINSRLAEAAINKRTKAIIVVHLYGYPANMKEIMMLSKKHNIYVVEDCAEAVGSRYENLHVGCFGDVGTFSFFGNKTITTGEGGMIVAKNEEIYNRAKILRDHGMSQNKRYWHDVVGYNYRLTNLQAAVGVAQLERVEYFIERKLFSANEYSIRLKDLEFIKTPSTAHGILNSYWMYTIVLDRDHVDLKKGLMDLLTANRIESRTVFYPLHLMPPYKKYKRLNETYKVSNYLSEGGVCLPSSPQNTEKDIDKVCNLIKDFFS